MSKMMWCPSCQKRVLAIVRGDLRYVPGGNASALPLVDTTYRCCYCGRELERVSGQSVLYDNRTSST